MDIEIELAFFLRSDGSLNCSMYIAFGYFLFEFSLGHSPKLSYVNLTKEDDTGEQFGQIEIRISVP